MGCFSSDTRPKTSATYGFANTTQSEEAAKFALGKINETISTQIDLHISLQNLPNLDVGSLTDSACVIYMFDKDKRDYVKIGETEVITDNLNPAFVKSVLVDYLFEETQQMKVVVFEIDDFKEGACVEQTFLGSAEFKLSQVASARNGMKMELAGKKGPAGEIIIQGSERKRGSRSIYQIELQGKDFTSPYIFYRLSKILPNGNFAAVFESETCQKRPDGAYSFKQASISSSALIEDDENRKAQIELFEWKKNGRHTHII